MKTLFYLDEISDKRIGKNQISYTDFFNKIYLKPNTLETNIGGFGFYTVNTSDTLQVNYQGLQYSYNDSDTKSNKNLTIAVNLATGQSYRIAGFSQDDLKGFWEDIQTENFYLDHKQSKKRFLKENKIIGLDLKCLFESMGKLYDPIQFPCTRKISDNLIITD